jgi:hypothetical protein
LSDKCTEAVSTTGPVQSAPPAVPRLRPASRFSLPRRGRRFRSPGEPTVARAEQSEIGAGEEMRWVPRIDRDDQRGIEEQADIGPEPRTA